MSKTFKVPFAFNEDGNVVDISTAKKGISYSCKECGEEVKLRGGETISNHLYHLSESECSLESSIHKAYKSVFSRIKKIKLPHDVNGSNFLEFDKVELERKIDNYIPDAIGYIGDKMYLVEFAKTSRVGERKLKKIKKSNLFCLEVSIVKHFTTILEIETHLLDYDAYKTVLYMPERNEVKELRDRFKCAYNKLLSDHKKEVNKYKKDINLLESEIKDTRRKMHNLDVENTNLRLRYETH